MDPIPADLAGKVISAHMRNVIDKVSQGGTLNAGEMKMFEQFTLEQSSLLKTRQAALVRRWVGGGRLSPDERAEIADIIPVTLEQPDPILAPEIPAAAGDQEPTYHEEYKVYADRYKHSDRTVKRWVKVGRNKKPQPDYCPLDEPEKMSAWFQRTHRQSPPEILERFRIEAMAAEILKAPAVPPRIEDPAAAAPTSSPPSPGRPDLKTGMLAALERLREAEAAAGAAYIEALAKMPQDVADVDQKQRRWERIADTLRKAEKDAGRILSDSGQLLSTTEVQQIIQEIFGNLFQTWRQFSRRTRKLMSGKSVAEQDAIWDAETDAQFDSFQKHQFIGSAA